MVAMLVMLTTTLLQLQLSAAYPEMAGSCGRPAGKHLPNEADTSDGGFAVDMMESVAIAGGAEQRSARVTLSHRSRTSLKGFLLRAVDTQTLAELGSFTELPPSTMLYEGCARPAAAVCQQGKGGHDRRRRRRLDEEHGKHHDKHDDKSHVALPAHMMVTWPADRELRLMFWAVDDKHRYYLAQTTSAPAGPFSAAASELDPRLKSCPREALPLPVIAASLAGFVLVVVLAAIPAVRRHPALAKVAVRHRTSQDLLPEGLMKLLPTLLQEIVRHYGGVGGWTLGQVGVVGLWLCAQGVAVAIAVGGVRGFPWDAVVVRVLGKLAASGFVILLLPITRSSVWPKLLGLSYERAVLWHRLASAFTLCVTGAHGIGMVKDYGFQESFSAEANCFGLGNLYGTLIFGAGGLLFVLSQAPVRRHSYRTFSMAHKVLVPAVLVLSCLHVSKLIYFLFPPIVLEIAYNRIGRRIQYRRSVQITEARVIPDGVILLRLRAPHIVAEIGQRGCDGLGSWVWLAVAGNNADRLNPHPFSVAGIDSSTNELKLLIKVGKTGSWTSSLAKKVNESSTTYTDGGSAAPELNESILVRRSDNISALEFSLDGPCLLCSIRPCLLPLVLQSFYKQTCSSGQARQTDDTFG